MLIRAVALVTMEVSKQEVPLHIKHMVFFLGLTTRTAGNWHIASLFYQINSNPSVAQ